MKGLRKNLPGLCVLVALAACTATDGLTPGMTDPSAAGGPADATGKWTPSVTAYPSRTPTISLTPTITPTPTPVPGLEFFNVAYDGGNIAGEIRNNTGQTIVMITSDAIPEFRFFFDYYEDVSYNRSNGTRVTKVDHWWWGPVEVYSEYFAATYEQMNCILYPGETGAIYFNQFGTKNVEGYYRNMEYQDTMPEALGLFYTYESQYLIDADLERIFHPPAENVSFHVEGERIYFEFDVDLPFAEAVDERKQLIDVPVFIKVFNEQGQLVDLIHNNLEIIHYVEFGKRNHVEGFAVLSGKATSEDYKDRDVIWENVIDLREFGPDTVNRIEVQVEYRWDPEVRQRPCIEKYPKR